MLTEKRIRDAKAGEKTRVLWDGQVMGLGVRIAPGGTKAYVLSYRAGGRKHIVTVARCAEIGLREARERAGAELARVRDGEPALLSRRREVRAVPTVGEGLDRFFAEFVEDRIALGKMKQRTVHEYRLQAASVIRPALGELQIEAVTRRDIEAMARPLRPVMRNRVLALTSRLFNLFESWEWCDGNPARFVDKASEEQRDRTLAESEIAALAPALEAEHASSPVAVAAIRLAAMTGLRISEVIAMQWADIDFERARVTLPTTKTGRRMQLLSSAALAALASHPRLHGCGYVFTTTGSAAITYKTTLGAFRRAAKRAGLEDVRLHDLRRTMMTAAAADGLSAHVVRELLGHKTATMADRYVRHAGAAVREATERLGNRVAALLDSDKPKAPVVAIGARRGR